MASVRNYAIGCGGCVGVLGLVVVMVWILCDTFLKPPGYSDPYFHYSPSPGDRYVVITESRNEWLDTYTKLWIAPSDAQRSEWHEIAPEVDGSWEAEWTSDHELVITNNGWPEGDLSPDGYRTESWGEVRIDMRGRRTETTSSSPDGQWRVGFWKTRDSRGLRSSAWLESTKDGEKRERIDLVPEGPWELQTNWVSSQRVEIHVRRSSQGYGIERPPMTWKGLEVTFVEDH